jgi:dienelactone hydrolase
MRRLISLTTILAALAVTAMASAQELAPGTILGDVKCVADATESYALYLPSTYSRDRPWSVLMAFHPGGRGRAMVETYRAAAEQYGYIVAGSNTSRNGPWAVSSKAVQAMAADLGQRVAIDARRIYLTGMSGGARVALHVALSTNAIAGVIASSAGFPDSQPRRTTPFVLFATAGAEDFNYLEMRALDRHLMSPHRLRVFDGGHTLPPDTVALEAIEWLELQAMLAGVRSRDESLIDRLLAARRRFVDAGDSAAALHQSEALVADFKSLRDVSPEEARVAALSKNKAVKAEVARERQADEMEQRTLDEFFEMEHRLRDPDLRPESLIRLRERLAQWARAAAQAAASAERDQARRSLSAAAAGASSRTSDAEYLKLLAQYRRSNLP